MFRVMYLEYTVERLCICTRKFDDLLICIAETQDLQNLSFAAAAIQPVQQPKSQARTTHVCLMDY